MCLRSWTGRAAQRVFDQGPVGGRHLSRQHRGVVHAQNATLFGLHHLLGSAQYQSMFEGVAFRFASDDLPPTLYADMGGSLMASEAVLQALLTQGVRTDWALLKADLARSLQGHLAQD